MKNSKRFKGILKTEFIGRVVLCTTPQKTKLEGIVVDETKHFMIIKTSDTNDVKKIAKQGSLFRMQFEDTIIEIKGDLLLRRSEERIKIK